MIEEGILDILQSFNPELPVVIGDLPSSEENNICILLHDGPGNTEFFGDRNCTTLYNPLIRIVVRNKSYDEGKQWVNAIHTTLHRYRDDQFMSIIIFGNPQYLGKSMQKLHEFQILFDAQVL